ncbi:MAG: formate dehydrogenase accessory sulfurtransferase FdhD [Acidimicrobiales bacterium]
MTLRSDGELVWEARAGSLRRRVDHLAVEEPLEIRCRMPGQPLAGKEASARGEGGRGGGGGPDGPGGAGGASGDTASAVTLTVTMRTPGHDFELAAGFLVSEGIVDSREDLRTVAYCTDADLDAIQRYNVVTAELAHAPVRGVTARLLPTSSSCGLCGAASIEALRAEGHPVIASGPLVTWDVLASVPSLLERGQGKFRSTGGIHGAALISPEGRVLVTREDIGRHNAVDKVVGWAILNGRFPLDDVLLAVSGRSSFEILQKALRAGIGFVAGVSAASNLAVSVAEIENVTLVGWLRGERCTIYTHPERVLLADGSRRAETRNKAHRGE